MMEDCATTMTAPQGCIDNKVVIEHFMEALKNKVGADRYRMWFQHGVDYALVKKATTSIVSEPQERRSVEGHCVVDSDQVNAEAILVSIRGQFALDRLRNHYLGELRGAACQAAGRRLDILFALHEVRTHQVDLPLGNLDQQPIESVSIDSSPGQGNEGDKVADQRIDTAHLTTATRAKTHKRSGSQHRSRSKQPSRSLGRLLQHATAVEKPEARATRTRQSKRAAKTKQGGNPNALKQLDFTEIENPASQTKTHADSDRVMHRLESTVNSGSKMNSGNFIPGQSNRLAHTAMVMACQDPSTASPLFLFGPTGTGKTHLLHAIADQLRRRYRFRRVMHLSAEQFTNDFISSVGNSGITSFRRRYREVDALLVDDVQFLGSKKATLREMLYTVETLGGQGKPLIFAGSESPNDIEGLSDELAGRMASGLVCQLQPLDSETREKLLRRWIDERCSIPVADSLIESIAPMLAGDGRVISGIVNMLNTLQRMLSRSPELQELRQFSGQLLRSHQSATTLGLIESAVCQAFQLPADSLRSKSQTRTVSGPRKLAMYLSRQLTPSAYSEIGQHFGGRSHSTAISAERHVRAWINEGTSVGRGVTAMSAREALERIELLLRTG